MSYYLLTRNAVSGSIAYYVLLQSIRCYYYSRRDYSVFCKTMIDQLLRRNIFINEGLLFGVIIGKYLN